MYRNHGNCILHRINQTVNQSIDFQGTITTMPGTSADDTKSKST